MGLFFFLAQEKGSIWISLGMHMVFSMSDKKAMAERGAWSA